VYYEQRPDDEERPPGCIDALVITRVVFATLLWPVVALLAVVIDAGLTIYLFASNPPLALIPIALTILAIWLFARWEQGRNRPPDV
jgi:hypothetical protein